MFKKEGINEQSLGALFPTEAIWLQDPVKSRAIKDDIMLELMGRERQVMGW